MIRGAVPAAATVAVIGLCVLTARVIQVLAASHLEHLEPPPDGPGQRRVPRSTEERRRVWGWTWLLGGAAVSGRHAGGDHPLPHPPIADPRPARRGAGAELPDLLRLRLEPVPRAAAAAQLAVPGAGDRRAPVHLPGGARAGRRPGRAARARGRRDRSRPHRGLPAGRAAAGHPGHDADPVQRVLVLLPPLDRQRLHLALPAGHAPPWPADPDLGPAGRAGHGAPDAAARAGHPADPAGLA